VPVLGWTQEGECWYNGSSFFFRKHCLYDPISKGPGSREEVMSDPRPYLFSVEAWQLRLQAISAESDAAASTLALVVGRPRCRLMSIHEQSSCQHSKSPYPRHSPKVFKPASLRRALTSIGETNSHKSNPPMLLPVSKSASIVPQRVVRQQRFCLATAVRLSVRRGRTGAEKGTGAAAPNIPATDKSGSVALHVGMLDAVPGGGLGGQTLSWLAD
jgi:hypothetical protein